MEWSYSFLIKETDYFQNSIPIYVTRKRILHFCIPFIRSQIHDFNQIILLNLICNFSCLWENPVHLKTLCRYVCRHTYRQSFHPSRTLQNNLECSDNSCISRHVCQLNSKSWILMTLDCVKYSVIYSDEKEYSY